MILIYFTAKTLFNQKIAFYSLFLLVFFPPDIMFSTINFSDLQAAFFVNIGIFLLIKAYQNSSILYSYFSGLFFFLSLLIKENIYFIFVLLLLILLFGLIKNKKLLIVLPSIMVFFFCLLIESIFYGIEQGDFIYRLTILDLNYIYCYYDFFPYTLIQDSESTGDYFSALINQVFLLNPKYLFLRRYYLFLPILAILQSLILLKNKDQRFLIFWFAGLAILMIGFTTSLTEYKPLDMRRNWYIFIILYPVIILSALFINRFKKSVKLLIFAAYIVGSILMCNEYRIFFDSENLNYFKSFIKNQNNKTIYADHHTMYGLEIISDDNNIISYSNQNINRNDLKPQDLIIINNSVIDELKLQKYSFPLIDTLLYEEILLKEEFGKFMVYEKL
jgi:4-amino-4-deoxy-L-arabinose transferase-like glycosyltransferase